jgi:transposase-like protein
MKALSEPDPLTVALRGKIREFIKTLVETELTEVLAAVRYERGANRQGYRHGTVPRPLTTGLGPTTLTLPPAPGTPGPGNGDRRMAQPADSPL